MGTKNLGGLNSPVSEEEGGTNATTFNDARTNMALNPLILEKTITYNVTPADRGLLIHYSGTGNVDLTLDPAATLGNGFNFILRNDATAKITVFPDLGELINGVTTLQLEPDRAITIFCTGSTFYTEGQVSDAAGANEALSNLSFVSINTPLLSENDNTLDFGAPDNRWANSFCNNYETGYTSGNTLTISGRNIGANTSVPFLTVTADTTTPTATLSGEVTGVTQSPLDNSTRLATTAYVDEATSGGPNANTSLSNLAAVAINTSLIPQTDLSEDLGSLDIRWNNFYGKNISTGDISGNTLTISGRNIGANTSVPFLTVTADTTTPTATLSGEVTGVTQSLGDSSLKLATTEFVQQQAGGGGSGRLLNTVVFTASGTWTKSANVNSVMVVVIGGGGGSGGNATTTTTLPLSAAGGGGGGGCAIKFNIDVSAIASVPVTVGLGGTAGVANSTGRAGNGSDSSFGTYCRATGGSGGSSTNVATNLIDPNISKGTGGGGAVGDLLFNGNGASIPMSMQLNASTYYAFNSIGGNSYLSGSSVNALNTPAITGSRYGQGATGAASGTATTGRNGAAGADGVVIIYEYS